MFPEVHDAVAALIDPASLRYISWSHFEVDECGALNEWLAIAPRAEPLCTEVGAMVNLADFASRPARGLKAGDVIATGRRQYRYIATPHLPHGWDAGVLFEEQERVLLCSDLFHQLGNVEAVTSLDVVGRFRQALATYQAHPVLMDYMPFTPNTRAQMERLAALSPQTLAAQHGSGFVGDGAAALRAAADVMQELLGTADTAIRA
jgi:flavorubredoxin